MAVTVVAADVTGGGEALLLETISKRPQADHQVFDNRSVLLGKTRKHGRSSKGCANPKVFFRVAWVEIVGDEPLWGYANASSSTVGQGPPASSGANEAHRDPEDHKGTDANPGASGGELNELFALPLGEG